MKQRERTFLVVCLTLITFIVARLEDLPDDFPQIVEANKKIDGVWDSPDRKWDEVFENVEAEGD